MGQLLTRSILPLLALIDLLQLGSRNWRRLHHHLLLGFLGSGAQRRKSNVRRDAHIPTAFKYSCILTVANGNAGSGDPP